jgi:hypothetical protein
MPPTPTKGGDLTLCRSNLNHYSMSRTAAFFFQWAFKFNLRTCQYVLVRLGRQRVKMFCLETTDLDLENFEHLIFVAQAVLNILEEPAASKPVVPTYVPTWHTPKQCYMNAVIYNFLYDISYPISDLLYIQLQCNCNYLTKSIPGAKQYSCHDRQVHRHYHWIFFSTIDGSEIHYYLVQQLTTHVTYGFIIECFSISHYKLQYEPRQCHFYCFPEHGNCHGMYWHMQAM